MPKAARFLLSEIGLALFLAQAGSAAGDDLVAVLYKHGLSLLAASGVILAVPLIVGLLFARFILRIGMLETLGGICGAMTSTPALGAIMSSTDSSLPATSYATVYPLALILVTLLAPILISQLS
jgi:putative transport protein